jgi:Trypsin-like peptidase domain
MRQTKFALLAIPILVVLTVTLSFAQEYGDRNPAPIKIGTVESIDVNVGHREMLLGREKQEQWSQTIHYPGASYIKVHFGEFKLPPGSAVTVSNPDLTEIYTYYSNPETSPNEGNSDYTVDEEGQGFWAMSITGDTAVITMHAGGRNDNEADYGKMSEVEIPSEVGISIDKYYRGFPEEEIEGIIPHSVFGVDDRRPAICYQNSRPTSYSRSRAVGRLLIGGGGLCTAWRLSSNNLVMTNNHCISTSSGVSGSEVWFNYQTTTCTGTTTAPITKVSGRTLLRTNFTLDYTLFSVNNFSSISGFGFLNLDPRMAVAGEEIYIPQHGGGQRKQLAIESDRNAGGICRVDDPLANGRGTDTDIAYRCDTSGGASGSPVLARSSHRVIALHHFGGSINSGARIQLIFSQISGFLP